MKRLLLAALATGMTLHGTAASATTFIIDFAGTGTYNNLLFASYQGSVRFDTANGAASAAAGQVTYTNVPLNSLPITDLVIQANGNTVMSGLAAQATLSSITLFTAGTLLQATGFSLIDNGLTFANSLATRPLASSFANLSGMGTLAITSFSIAQAAVQPVTPAAPVPEAATWAMMLAGFGLLGASQRRRRRLAAS